LEHLKIRQRGPGTVEQLVSYIRKEWGNILQFPDVYRLLLKEEGRLHGGENGPVPTFFRWAAVIKLKMS